jgi:hypothetical protein
VYPNPLLERVRVAVVRLTPRRHDLETLRHVVRRQVDEVAPERSHHGAGEDQIGGAENEIPVGALHLGIALPIRRTEKLAAECGGERDGIGAAPVRHRHGGIVV